MKILYFTFTTASLIGRVRARSANTAPAMAGRNTYASCSIDSKIELTMTSTNANASAHQKPSTWNPGTIALTSKTKKPIITKVNKPSVAMFTGKVRIKSRGPKNALTIARSTATMTAVRKPETVTPGRR